MSHRVPVRDAYDIAYVTAAETCLATYSYPVGAREATTEVLFGEVSPRGTLPVTIPIAGDPDTAGGGRSCWVTSTPAPTPRTGIST